jgi:hypothetical protein
MEKSNATVGEMLMPVPPGISWTADPKSRPWLRPPEETDVVTIANNYITRLSSVDMMNDMLDVLETEVPLSVIAESFVMHGVSTGKHTLDAAVLVMPVVIEVLKTLAAVHKIDVVTFPKELEKGTTVHPRVLKQAISSMTTAATETTTEPVVAEEPMAKGLMSRMKKEGVE